MKKKLLSIIFMGVLIVGLTGCGSANKELNSSNSQNKKNDEKVTEKNEVKADTITCRELGYSDKYDKKENIFVYKEGKLYQWKTQKITINGASKSELEKYCGKANESNHGRVNIIEENSCYHLFDFEKMTDEEFNYFPNLKELGDRTIDEEFEKLKDDIYLTCKLGKEEIKLISPKSVDGNYKGVNNYLDNNYNLLHDDITIEFKNGNYSYTLINGNNFTGTYTYDGNKLILKSNDEDQKMFGASWYTGDEFYVYNDLDEYDILIVDSRGAKVLKLNKN